MPYEKLQSSPEYRRSATAVSPPVSYVNEDSSKDLARYHDLKAYRKSLFEGDLALTLPSGIRELKSLPKIPNRERVLHRLAGLTRLSIV